MDYQKIKEEVKQIVAIVDEVPDSLKERCFELLFTELISSMRPGSPRKIEPISQTVEDLTSLETDSSPENIPMNTQIRIFLRRTSATVDSIAKVILYDGTDVHFIQKPQTKIVSQGQIQWALLLGLKNAILGNDFLVDPEDLRETCKTEGFYDAPNYARHLKNNSSLFKQPLESKGDPQLLSDEGQNELAQLIESLARTA